MRMLLTVLGISALVCSPALAGKNANGAVVVHTDDDKWFTSGICRYFDMWYPDITCSTMNTQTNQPWNRYALIWFIAAFPPSANPGVQAIHFGLDHNLPDPDYFNVWGLCGPAGSFELPDAGWPDEPAVAGNTVWFALPIEGDTLFPFYYFAVWGFAGAYYCSDINPVSGYAEFVDNSDPPVEDVITKFGCVRWYQEGYNECPAESPLGACCYGCEECLVLTETDCIALPDDYQWIEGEVCDPNPCPPVATQTTTWGSIKAVYR